MVHTWFCLTIAKLAHFFFDFFVLAAFLGAQFRCSGFTHHGAGQGTGGVWKSAAARLIRTSLLGLQLASIVPCTTTAFTR